MSRFYVPKEAIEGNMIRLSGPEAHHILDVMRLKKGDSVAAFDGSGREYAGIIKETRPKDLTIEVTSTREAAACEKVAVTLAQAIPKKDKMDYIVEKATELGVHAIAPVETMRTIVRLKGDKAKERVERWQRIAREAAKQCGRTTVPAVEKIKDYDSFLKDAKGYDLSLMACLSEGTIDIKEALRKRRAKNVLLCVGPEGDFTPDEIVSARSCGMEMISLGPMVLKSDTAGLAALAVINYEYGN